MDILQFRYHFFNKFCYCYCVFIFIRLNLRTIASVINAHDMFAELMGNLVPGNINIVCMKLHNILSFLHLLRPIVLLPTYIIPHAYFVLEREKINIRHQKDF